MIETFIEGEVLGTLAMKLGIFSILFVGLLLATERSELIAGIQELQRALWMQQPKRA